MPQQQFRDEALVEISHQVGERRPPPRKPFVEQCLDGPRPTQTDGNSYFGLAIGFTVLAGAFAVGQVSGAAFNPAVAIGASIRGLLPWFNLWLYIVAELLGGAVAAFVFKALNPSSRPGTV